MLVLECATKDFRGGNSRHTRDIRYMHKAATGFVTGAYGEEEFWRDLLGVTGGATNERLARLTIRESETLGDWMPANGVRWQKPLRGTLHLTRSNLFMLGGGKAMMNAYYDTAAKLGVEIAYETEVRELKMTRRRVCLCRGESQWRRQMSTRRRLSSSPAGGFEANIPWLKEYWGDAADNFIIRGTPHNQGRMLKELLRHGAKPVGDPRGCHAVALDARAPKFDGGIVTRLDSVPFGIVVNKEVKRFYDEGEDFWPKRYAIWGKLIAEQPEQIAYSIIDSKGTAALHAVGISAGRSRLDRRARQGFGLDPNALAAVVDEFNRSVRGGQFDPGSWTSAAPKDLIHRRATGRGRIDTPPYYGYPLRPGITFTYLGVTVDEQAQVIMQDDRPAKNIFAAGEMMAGNILGRGYLAGFGLTIGSVFGRIAGREAARCAGF